MEINRRKLIHVSVASLSGIILAKLGSRQANSQNISDLTAQKTTGLTLLPSDLSVGFMEKILLLDPSFRSVYDYFENEGMKFNHERVQALAYEASGEPALLAVVPGSTSMQLDKTFHEVVGISVIYYKGKANAIVANKTKIGHNPYKILSYTIVELSKAGEIVEHIVERQTIEEFSPEKIASQIGSPEIDPSNEVNSLSPVLSNEDIESSISQIYRKLLTDSYTRQTYPPGAIESLLEDTPIVQKWALVQSARFSGLSVSLASLIEGQNLLIASSTYCCSTSSSCQGCTSTSTSVSCASLGCWGCTSNPPQQPPPPQQPQQPQNH